MVDFKSIGTEPFLNYDNRTLAERDTIQYSVSLGLIMIVFFVDFICLSVSYNDERQKRLEFLLKNRIEVESKLVKNIFSMLVPKFIEKAITEQSYLFYH